MRATDFVIRLLPPDIYPLLVQRQRCFAALIARLRARNARRRS